MAKRGPQPKGGKMEPPAYSLCKTVPDPPEWLADIAAAEWICWRFHLPALGMFESWSRVMGGILQVAGVPGFLSNLSDFYESTDTEGEMVRSFLAAWWEQYQDKELGVADLYRLCSGEDGRILDLGDGTERSQKTRLGKLLGDLRDRHYQLEDDVTVRISLAGTLRRARQWRLDTASGEAENVHQVHHDGGDGGEPGEPGEHFPLASSAAEDLESHLFD